MDEIEKIKSSLVLFPEEKITNIQKNFRWIQYMTKGCFEDYSYGFQNNYLIITNKRVVLCYGKYFRRSLFYPAFMPKSLSLKDQVKFFQYHENYCCLEGIRKFNNKIILNFSVTGIGPILKFFSKSLNIKATIELDKFSNASLDNVYMEVNKGNI